MNWKERLKRNGLEIVSKRHIPPSSLHIRYIPQIFSPKFWRDADPMWLPSSPHVQLMQIFNERKFDVKAIEQSDYFGDRRFRRKAGMKKWTDKHIWEHIKHGRYAVFKSIKRNGFDAGLSGKNPIVVLDQPFWKTRYGAKEPWLSGNEIWNGAGRCAAAFVLDYDLVPCVMVRDALPGTGKSPLDNKLKGVKQ